MNVLLLGCGLDSSGAYMRAGRPLSSTKIHQRMPAQIVQRGSVMTARGRKWDRSGQYAGLFLSMVKIEARCIARFGKLYGPPIGTLEVL